MAEQSKQLDTQKNKVTHVRGMLLASEAELHKALAGHVRTDQFMRVCMSIYQKGGKDMRDADPISFIGACMEAAQLGLRPDRDECYLIPRWNKHAQCVMVNFQLGWRGMVKLASRSREVLDIAPEVVFTGCEWSVTKGTARGIHHVPYYMFPGTERGEVVAAYATAVLKSGIQPFEVVDRATLDSRAEMSGKPSDKTPSHFWRDHFVAMCKKTAIRELCKFRLPLHDEVKAAFEKDAALEVGDAPEPPIITDMRAGPPQRKTLDDIADEYGIPSAPPDREAEPSEGEEP